MIYKKRALFCCTLWCLTVNNIDYSSNLKDICKALGKKCKRKLNRPKMRLDVGLHILKGHLIIRPDLCGYCGEGG